MDKLRLKQNKLNTRDYYLIGKTFNSDIIEARYKATQGLRDSGRAYRVLYCGTVTGIKPYTINRVLAGPPDHFWFKGTDFLDYLNPLPEINPHRGIGWKESWLSALRLWEQRFGYFPAHIFVLEIEAKNL